MFRYSQDEFIADQQLKITDEIYLMLSKECNLFRSNQIEKIFDNAKMTFEYLIDLAKIVEKNTAKITMVIVPRCSNYIKYGAPYSDVKQGFDLRKTPKDSLIPYVEYSFHEGYENPHGSEFEHCFFLFFTEHNSFEESEEYTKYWLKRITILRAFL